MRPEKVKEKAAEIIEQGQRPSVIQLSQELGYNPTDVHRCLNILEKRNEVETYTQEALGQKNRLVGIKRN